VDETRGGGDEYPDELGQAEVLKNDRADRALSRLQLLTDERERSVDGGQHGIGEVGPVVVEVKVGEAAAAATFGSVAVGVDAGQATAVAEPFVVEVKVGEAAEQAAPVVVEAASAVPDRPATASRRPWWKAKPRPKYPNDWRKFVGAAGWSFITVGVLILLFVVYQLWGTGIQYAAAQDDLAKQFAARQAQIAAAGTGAPPAATVPASTPPSTLPSSVSQAASSAPSVPVSSPVSALVSSVPDTAVPSVAAAPSTAAATRPLPVLPPVQAAPYPGAPIQLGDAIGILTIPKIGVHDYVLAGVRTQDIAKGIGHFPDTPLPGQQGNAAVAGHRTTHGGVFGDLDQLVPGDEIDFTSLSGATYTYVMTASTVVRPNQVEVLADHPDKVMLTMSTCTPIGTAKYRLIVTAELKPAGQPSVQPATKEYGNPSLYDNGARQDDSTGSLGPDEGSSLAPGQSLPPTVPGAVAVQARAASASAFNQGWFSDSAAWLPVVLWGLALTALAAAAWVLSRTTRRLIGWGVALIPFVVLLYFWFENVSRLLPPNL
jgi:sortase A